MSGLSAKVVDKFTGDSKSFVPAEKNKVYVPESVYDLLLIKLKPWDNENICNDKESENFNLVYVRGRQLVDDEPRNVRVWVRLFSVSEKNEKRQILCITYG